MNNVLILNGDIKESGINFPNERFLFLITKYGVWHIDLSDGQMYKAKEDLSNLSEEHQAHIRLSPAYEKARNTQSA